MRDHANKYQLELLITTKEELWAEEEQRAKLSIGAATVQQVV